jgi:cell division protein FtsX
VGAIGDFQAPMWPVRLIMLVGLSVTVLCFLMLVWMDLRRMATRNKERSS